jgi:hypothetical protein
MSKDDFCYHNFATKTGFRRAVEALITADHVFIANPGTKHLAFWPRSLRLLESKNLLDKGLIPHPRDSRSGG